MLDELYNDPGLPAIGSAVDPLFPLTLLRGWEVSDVQCGAPVPEIVLLAEYSSQTIITSTNADSNGPVIFRQRSLPVDVVVTKDNADADLLLIYKDDRQIADDVIQRSLMVFDCERYEDNNPEPRARPLLSAVNSLAWNGFAPRTVLFSEFSGDTRDNNNTWFCNYSFVHDPQTWDRAYFYVGPDGTKPPDYGVTAELTASIYPEADFGPLNITLP